MGQLVRDLNRQRQEAEIENILLPSQQHRLKQIAWQMKMKRLGAAKLITNQLATELELSDEQKEQIVRRASALQQEIVQKMTDLKANAKKELLKELTQDQQAKFEELIGDELIIIKEENQNRQYSRFYEQRKSPAHDF